VNPVLQDLNPPQREAVTLPGGPCLVLAGAGSGKTRVLTHRIAWLVREAGVPGREIIAVTFTNKAAGEMRARAGNFLGAAAPGLFIGTFHAWCVRLLRREADRAGHDPGFTIYDTPEQLAVVKQAMKEADLSERDFAPRRVLSKISTAKNRLLGPERFRASGPFGERITEVYACYQRLLEGANAFDFDDLIMKSVLLLEGDEETLERYQERTRHLLVDEYQDTNHAQYRLIKSLSGRHRNLMVVGDEDQSIFSWRGADISNILEFERDFPDARTIRLEQNYRSTSRILAAALAVVSNNVKRKGKALWTENLEGEQVRLYRAADGIDEAAWVVSRIREHARSVGSLSDLAIMYRTHAQSRPLEEELLRADIPYIVLGGVRFYQRREVKDLLAYLSLAVNPHDPAAFLRVVNVPARGIGKKTQDAIHALARAADLSMYGALEKAAAGETDLPSRAVVALKGFHAVAEALRREAERKPPDQLLESVLKLTGYLASFENEPAQEQQARRENVEQLVSAAGEAVVRGEGTADFLAGVALQSDVDALRQEETVPLMTLHSAKGLEFDLVFLVGLDEGLLPHANSLHKEDALEEERRLCYVGMTRARRTLCLCTAATRNIRGQIHDAMPSRFLEEIPGDHLEVRDSPLLLEATQLPQLRRARRLAAAARAGPGPAAPSKHDLSNISTQKEALAALERHFGDRGRRAAKRLHEKAGSGGLPPSDLVPPCKETRPARPGKTATPSFRKGDKVRHEQYGAGVVLAVQPVPNDQKLTVLFSAHGRKKFLASHTPLSPLLRG